MHIIGKGFIIVFLLTLLGFFIRAYKITSSPDGLYIDETSIGFNAYSIVKTLHDEHGHFMPLFFEAFGEYKLPTYIYIVALVQLFTGPIDLSVRLPSLIFGTLCIPLIYLFTKELFKNTQERRLKTLVPIIASFMLAVSPWHFQFSRPGFEAGLGLFFLILALYLFFMAVNKNSPRTLLASLISFVLTLYSYNSARIVVPLIAFALFVLYYKQFHIKSWLFTIFIPLVVATPFLLFSFSDAGLARARQVSVFSQKNVSVATMASNYLKNVSPVYLFIRGDPTIAHLSPNRMSLLYPVEAPFFFLGVFMLIIKKSKVSFFLLFLLFLSFIPSALSTLTPHALRSIFALAVTPIITSLGFITFLKIAYKENLYILLLGVFVLLILFSALNFINIYHSKYALSAGWDWQVGIKRAANKVKSLEKNYQDIYLDLDPRSNPLVWYLKIDPGVYQASMDKNNIGKYHFNQKINTSHGLYVGPQIKNGTHTDYVFYPDNSVAYGVWEF